MDTKMDIDVRKQKMLIDLKELEDECNMLLSRIDIYREDLLNVKTEKEAMEFDNTHNLEEGLKIIVLF